MDLRPVAVMPRSLLTAASDCPVKAFGQVQDEEGKLLHMGDECDLSQYPNEDEVEWVNRLQGIVDSQKSLLALHEEARQAMAVLIARQHQFAALLESPNPHTPVDFEESPDGTRALAVADRRLVDAGRRAADAMNFSRLRGYLDEHDPSSHYGQYGFEELRHPDDPAAVRAFIEDIRRREQVYAREIEMLARVQRRAGHLINDARYWPPPKGWKGLSSLAFKLRLHGNPLYTGDPKIRGPAELEALYKQLDEKFAKKNGYPLHYLYQLMDLLEPEEFRDILPRIDLSASTAAKCGEAVVEIVRLIHETRAKSPPPGAPPVVAEDAPRAVAEADAKRLAVEAVDWMAKNMPGYEGLATLPTRGEELAQAVGRLILDPGFLERGHAVHGPAGFVLSSSGLELLSRTVRGLSSGSSPARPVVPERPERPKGAEGAREEAREPRGRGPGGPARRGR